MLLTQLLAGLPDVLAVYGQTDAPITGIVADSRQVTPGVLFVAYQGIGVDGHRFIGNALGSGAAAIVGEQAALDLPVPYVQVKDGRAAWGRLASAWYGHPSRAMTVVGITGTDGKTTTANLLFSILRTAGCKTGLISTVNAVIGDRTYDTGLHTTTPDAPDVQRFLAQMRDAGTEIAVLEVTSHGLAQQRVAGCIFDVAVVTNITHEHLDFHRSYEAYRGAKAMLFRSLTGETTGGASIAKPGDRGRLPRTAVLNRDDSSYDYLAGIPAGRQIGYGLSSPGAAAPTADGQAALIARNVRHLPAGTVFEIEYQSAVSGASVDCWPVLSPLIGDFNVSNILAAASAALALGIEPSAIQGGIECMAGIPGRMERINQGQDFTAIVDFAHTPNALARALETTRALAGGTGRTIVVFGCAGLRDREKRRMMGEVAARLADYTVITAEDPRTEDLPAIMAETAHACSVAGRVEGRDFGRVADRQQAILHAVTCARPGDVVLVCGKGHEQSMCFGTTEHPWRDQEALRWAIDRRNGLGDAMPPYVLPTWA